MTSVNSKNWIMPRPGCGKPWTGCVGRSSWAGRRAEATGWALRQRRRSLLSGAESGPGAARVGRGPSGPLSQDAWDGCAINVAAVQRVEPSRPTPMTTFCGKVSPSRPEMNEPMA
eukprot:scaffold4581_cov63-Phaeocystis_antarctica.AAC.1